MSRLLSDWMLLMPEANENSALNAAANNDNASLQRAFQTFIEASQHLELAYEDDGIGIPAPEKARIFTCGYGRNTGLGLFVIEKILSTSGISITETGEPGKGARFVMRVPEGAFRFAPAKGAAPGP